MAMPESSNNQDVPSGDRERQENSAQNASTFKNPLVESEARRAAEPCQVVIFGASGDLTGRKLIPALYNLQRDNLLPKNLAITGFARRSKSHDEFRKEMIEQIGEFSRSKPESEDLNGFTDKIYYHQSNFDDDDGYQSLDGFLKDLDKKLNTGGNRIFYLSVKSSYFLPIVEKLHKNGLINTDKDKGPWTRVIIEKPFGTDLDSAVKLQEGLTQFLREDQMYRIDHYLGKETVQNLLVLRFTNPIFESLWNSRHIENIQITFAEELGIGERGPTYESSGLLRDILQNHLTQVLSIVCMEPPSSLEAEAIRDEKVKVVQSIRKYNPQEILKNTVRAQYNPGFINGEPVKGYREEDRVDPNSNRETFGAMKLFVDNWRWAGVPIYIRAGKRMAKRATEIHLQFKKPPSILFFQDAPPTTHNAIIIRLQPDEGVSLLFDVKVPGTETHHQQLNMDFKYSDYFGSDMPEAYERLIHDCMLGDATLFARYDEVYWSWKFYDPIVRLWESTPLSQEEFYPAGMMGTAASDMLLFQSGYKWNQV